MENFYGYARVSTREQNVDRQLAALCEAGVPKGNIFVDKVSGKDFNRSEYQRMVRRLRQGTVLFVLSIDRLGRNYREIIEEWRSITQKKQADIVVLNMPLLDTRTGKGLMGTFISDLVLQILSFVAEHERANIRERQREGIRAAKRRGVQFGRPSLPLPPCFQEQRRLWLAGSCTLQEAATACGMTLSTFYRRARPKK